MKQIFLSEFKPDEVILLNHFIKQFAWWFSDKELENILTKQIERENYEICEFVKTELKKRK